MYCGKCGQELPDQAQFCWKCGHAIAATGRLAATPSLVELSCPKCAGRLAVSPDLNKLTCGSCGSELLIVRDDKTVTLRLGRQEQELISALAPTTGPKEKLCPSCGRIDQVQAVSAVAGSGEKPAWNPSVTAQRLSLPAPTRENERLLRSGLSCLFVGWIVGLFMLVLSAKTGLVFIVGGTVGLLGFTLVYSRQKREHRKAIRLNEIVNKRWQTVNYCHRCDRVFAPGASIGVSPDEMKRRLYAEAAAS